MQRQTFHIILDDRRFDLDIEWSGELEITAGDKGLIIKTLPQPFKVYHDYEP